MNRLTFKKVLTLNIMSTQYLFKPKMSFIIQLQTLGAQNALWQSQLSSNATAVLPSLTPLFSNSAPEQQQMIGSTSTPTALHHSVSTPSSTLSTSCSTSTTTKPHLNGFAQSDLQALQMALQQQQQNLQQQLQNFIILQQPANVQASAILLQSQISQAVAQATNQLRILQQRHDNILENANNSTPKSSLLMNNLHTPTSSSLSLISKSPENNGFPMKMTSSPKSSPPLNISTNGFGKSILGHNHPMLRQPPFTPPMMNSYRESVIPSPNHQTFPSVPRLDLPADENVDLEELEQFAKEFKQRRIKLGKSNCFIDFSFFYHKIN